MPRIKTNKNNPEIEETDELFSKLALKEFWQCRYLNCCKVAVYGDVEGVNLFCGIHKDEGHILTFQQDQINKISSFEFHKKEELCLYKGCFTKKNFNYKGEKRALFCKSHMLCSMINIKTLRCIKCNKGARTYNLEGQPARYCKKCKTADMINIKAISKLCPRCNKRQKFYNFAGEKDGLYCGNCKDEDMIDIRNNKCEKCHKHQKNFNYPTEKKAIYCGKCREKGMIYISRKRCEKCNIYFPVFNYKGEKKGIYCFNCKEDTMENVEGKKCAICYITRANYNYPGIKSAIVCGKCQKQGMINVINKLCLNDWCNTRAPNKLYNGYCSRCFFHMFPDSEFSRNYKVKEKHVTDSVKEMFPDLNMIIDKRVHGGCSKRRPDILIELFTHIIIIECDENQHQDYNTTCEIARINELYTDLGDRPIIFIRFNPDGYIINGKKFKSSFKAHKILGTPIINNQEEWQNRLTTLKNTIQINIDSIPTEQITEEYLYFDQIDLEDDETSDEENSDDSDTE